jgi:hypothetical protein
MGPRRDPGSNIRAFTGLKGKPLDLTPPSDRSDNARRIGRWNLFPFSPYSACKNYHLLSYPLRSRLPLSIHIPHSAFHPFPSRKQLTEVPGGQ